LTEMRHTLPPGEGWVQLMVGARVPVSVWDTVWQLGKNVIC
jgi:hypothetical protein